MFQYTAAQWILFFYLYCFLGWCFESTYVSLKSRKFINRGFMRGPFLPLYGSGAIMMLVLSAPFGDNYLLVYLSGFVGATALEYVTGAVMEALFKVRYWDYTGKFCNIKGYICLGSSIAWGFLTILMTRFLHQPVASVVLKISEPFLSGITFVLTILIVVDFSLSFKAALDLRDVLVKMEKAKEEWEHLQKRLDVIIAVAGEAKEEYVKELEEKVGKMKILYHMDELQTGIESRLERLKGSLSGIHSDKLEEFREEISELRIKYSVLMADRLQLKSLKDFYRRHLILDNPSMKSIKFRESLEELKEAAQNRIKNNDRN